jgi:hypothetical protein
MSDFRSTRLWQETLAARHNDPHEAPRERLRNALEKFRERASILAGEIPQDLRDLTVHDITHLDALWETADVVSGDDLPFTPTEGFVLGGAFLLHDLGMSIAAFPGGLSELRQRPEWNDRMIGAIRRVLGRDPGPEDLVAPPPEAVEDVKFSLLRSLHAEQAEQLASNPWKDPWQQ